MPHSSRNRSSVKVFHGGGNHERRVLFVVSHAKATQMLNAYRATMVFDDDGEFLGVRLCESRHAAKKAVSTVPKITEEMKRNMTVLSRAEAEAIAFRAKSRTEGLTDAQRDARVLAGLPEMDLPERARAKFHHMFGHAATA